MTDKTSPSALESQSSDSSAISSGFFWKILSFLPFFSSTLDIELLMVYSDFCMSDSEITSDSLLELLRF